LKRFFYFDTSALAKRYAQERGSERIDLLLAEAENIIVIGNIAVTELYSALSKKLRTHEISEPTFLAAIYSFEKDIAESKYRFLEIDNDIITASKTLILAYPGLRTYDALHLALALQLAELDPIVVSGDGMLLTTAASEGMEILNPEQ